MARFGSRASPKQPEDIAAYGPLDGRDRSTAASSCASSARQRVSLIARLSGVEDRDRAEALRGLRLYLPRAALPPTGAEEYYHADLIGLEAVLGDGTPVGRVRAVHDFGAGDTLELARPGAPPVMVPFTRAVVPIVELAAGRLVLDPPPGLLDDETTGMTWRATVLTIFPEMLPGPLAYSLAGKALRAGLWRLETVDIRGFRAR